MTLSETQNSARKVVLLPYAQHKVTLNACIQRKASKSGTNLDKIMHRKNKVFKDEQMET